MPRFRDFSFDEDPFDRPARRQGTGRRAGAIADLADAFDDPDDAAPLTELADGPDVEPDRRRGHKPRRADGSESFKCGHCKAFIGPTVAGGRHRNHCPLCLYSRHVDDRQMGDRASTCRALMAPIGYFYRPKGEQVVVHRCLGCGFERHNRVAADDNFLVMDQLPELPPRGGEGGGGRQAGSP